MGVHYCFSRSILLYHRIHIASNAGQCRFKSKQNCEHKTIKFRRVPRNIFFLQLGLLVPTGVLISPYPDQEGNKLMFLSEWSEFPLAPCLSGKNLDDSSRLDVVEIARVPDMLSFLDRLRTYQHPLLCYFTSIITYEYLNILRLITIYTSQLVNVTYN